MKTTRSKTTGACAGGALRGAAQVVAAAVLASLLVVVPVPKPAAASSSAGTFFPLPPARVLDTRTGNGAPMGPVGPGAVLSFVVTGRGGVPATDVSAVVLNMTVVAPTAGSYMTVWPTGEQMPTASNLNYSPGQTVPNLVKVKVGSGGQVSVFNAAGTVHVLADVAGWYKAGADPTEGARYNAISPSRILDTRTGNGAPVATVGPGAAVDLQVTGRGGVPATGVSAVAMNVTVVGPSAPSSYLTAWPTGETRPTASNLNYVAGDVVPNLVIVKVGASGAVSLYNDAGQTHILSDVVGWYSAPAGPGTIYAPLSPARILDTRTGNGAPTAPISGGSPLELQVTGRGGVPLADVAAVVLNVTAVNPTAESYMTVWPTAEPRPTASNLNYRAGAVVPNLVIVKVGLNGKVSLYNDSGQTNVIADVVGWFGAPPPTVFVNRSQSVTFEHPHLYVPSNISAPAGSRVTMTFQNPTDELHTWTSPSVGVDRAVDPFQTIQFSFTMPFSNTPFICLIHQSEGMVGTLVPTAPS